MPKTKPPCPFKLAQISDALSEGSQTFLIATLKMVVQNFVTHFGLFDGLKHVLIMFVQKINGTIFIYFFSSYIWLSF